MRIFPKRPEQKDSEDSFVFGVSEAYTHPWSPSRRDAAWAFIVLARGTATIPWPKIRGGGGFFGCAHEIAVPEKELSRIVEQLLEEEADKDVRFLKINLLRLWEEAEKVASSQAYGGWVRYQDDIRREGEADVPPKHFILRWDSTDDYSQVSVVGYNP